MLCPHSEEIVIVFFLTESILKNAVKHTAAFFCLLLSFYEFVKRLSLQHGVNHVNKFDYEKSNSMYLL